jgi:glycerol-3-phosphate dehydrogenase subunit C
MSQLPPRKPPRAPEWDPNTERYWDPRDLEDELRRTFQICHECRMCVTFCGAFPLLFDAVDRQVDAGRAEGAERLGSEVMAEVSDHCWQCKLCYIKCPYTDDEGAPERLDFPRLMARERLNGRAVRAFLWLIESWVSRKLSVRSARAGRRARPISSMSTGCSAR